MTSTTDILLCENYQKNLDKQLLWINSFYTIMTILDFITAHETQMIEGLQAVENISLIEICLSLSIRLLVLT